jgi:hypothetical protein
LDEDNYNINEMSMANGGPKRKQSSHRPPKHHESLEIKKAKTEKNFDIKEEVKE